MLRLSLRLSKRQRGLAAVALGVAALCVFRQTCRAADNTPVVIVRVDDCRVDDPSTSWRQPRAALDGKSPYQYARDHSIPIVWGIIASWPEKNLCLSWTELENYIAACGGEVASHSLTHGNPQSVSEACFEITQSRAVIETNLPGRTCHTFIQPGTWTTFNLDRFYELDTSLGQALQSTYKQSRAYMGGGWVVGAAPYRHGLFELTSLDRRGNWTPESLAVLLEVIASTPGAVASFQLHQVNADSAGGSLYTPESIFKQFIDTLNTMRNQGRIRLMPFRDTFELSYDPAINRIPDSGFEKCVLGLGPCGPWFKQGEASIQETGGQGDSQRYCRVAGNESFVKTGNNVLPPGRYELSWYQKCEVGWPNASLKPYVIVTAPEASRPGVNSKPYSNFFPDMWEMKKALFLVPYGYPQVNVLFQPTYNSTFGIDNVSIVSAPLKPNISCTQTTVTQIPGQCKVRWRTPADPEVISVCVIYDSKAHPTNLSEGIVLGSAVVTPDDLGAFQELTVGFDWNNKPRLYFSVFAVRSDGSAAPPDLFFWIAAPTAQIGKIDSLGPTSVNARWSAFDRYSTIVDYEYVVGATPGSSEVIASTHTTQTSVVIENLPLNQTLYLSVRAENSYGVWSDWASKALPRPPVGVWGIRSLPNGSKVSVEGVISAKYADCYYVRQLDRYCGIKILGQTSASEGELVVVSGTIDQPPGSGERCIIPD